MATVRNSMDIQVEVSSTTYVPFDDHICNTLDVFNNTGVDIYITTHVNGVAGVEYLCLDGTYKRVEGIENASQVEVALARAGDAVNVVATVYA